MINCLLQQSLTTESSRGSFEEYREIDLLSQALGNKEHPGRTRGMGVYVPWRHGFPDYSETYRSRKRSKAYRSEQIKQELRAQLEEQLSASLQEQTASLRGEIDSLREELRQVRNQSQPTPSTAVPSPPQRRSSCASTPISEHSDAHLPIDDIQVMYLFRMVHRSLWWTP